MTAEIVNLLEYRERKLREDKASGREKNADAPSRARSGKGNDETGADGTEETGTEDLLENDDENRGGEPV